MNVTMYDPIRHRCVCAPKGFRGLEGEGHFWRPKEIVLRPTKIEVTCVLVPKSKRRACAELIPRNIQRR